MAYSELVKDINKIRSIIRDYYVYGFYTRDEYAELYRMSPRSYDNERRRVESWMQEYLMFYQNASGKKVFLSVDGNSILHNPLYRAFKAKSFTANDVLLHFYLMDLFAGGQALGPNEIEDLLWDEYGAAFEKRGMPDTKTIRLKLEDLTGLGLLIKEKDKRQTRYRIMPDQTDLTLPGVRDALSFFSEEAPLGVIGSFLLDKRTAEENDVHCFRFRHHYLMQAVDSSILSELLTAIDEKREIMIQVDNVVKGLMEYPTVPLKVFVSTGNGREYLLSWSREQERFFFTRIDRIVWVKQLEETFSRDLAEERFQTCRKWLWGVSFGGLEEVHNIVHIEMEISAGDDEGFIVRRLMREKRCGTVSKVGKDRYLFSADVYDAMEMLPWICSFSGRILRLECGDRNVILKYYEYLTRMAAFYEEDPGENKDTGLREAAENRGEMRLLSRMVKSAPSKERHDLVFHEVYGAYYNALARILALAVRKELTPGKLYHIVHDSAFGESGMNLPDRLFSGEWPFLTEELETNLKKEPVMPLTIIQKRWLRSLMEDPRIHLFLDDETYRILAGQLKNVRPLCAGDTFCYFDRFSDGDPYGDPEYIRHFRTVLSAVRERKELLVSYRNRFGEEREMRVMPDYIEYSGRDDKFRLYAEPAEDKKWDEPMRLNISRIEDCEVSAEAKDPAVKTKAGRKSVVLELTDDENTLERAMFHFSFLEKKTERLENGIFRITLFYHKADETEILIRILSFGHQLNVISEGNIRDETASRILTQRNILSGQPL